jgi:type IV pilus assembly protein PilE
MFTLPAVCKISQKRAMTAVEVIVVMVIVAVVAAVSLGSWGSQIERERADNAKTNLKLLLQSEENFFTWKNRYCPEWESLDIDNPNKVDKCYEYKIERAESTSFLISATRKGKNTGFRIDQSGNITQF